MFGNHDQSTIWYLLFNGSAWVPLECAEFAGTITKQNWQKTLTNAPTIYYQFETRKVEWGN